MTVNKLIIIPYAFGGNTGVSIQHLGNQMTTYLKNSCVACISAKKNSGEDVDVMIVTNIDIPEPYTSLLKSEGVLITKCPFDRFVFGSLSNNREPVLWQLAYYKLCAIDFCVRKMNYDYYCYMDSDVYVQRSFDRIWHESKNNIMLYDLNEPSDGYLVEEMRRFLKTDNFLTHFGGEFFAASKALAQQFIMCCGQVYDEMLDVNYVTNSGDEFIVSIAASKMRMNVKNAGSYVHRYWTGAYRLMCNDYEKNNIIVLHIPAEKEYGIIKLFDHYFIKGILPTKEVVWKTCNFKHQSMRVRLGLFLRRIGVVK